jgi:hypothetical protein
MTLSQKWSTPATFIVAWSDQPISGLTIGKEGARAQNLSLIVLRVENDAALRPLLARGNASTSGEARVRLVGSEAVPAPKAGISQGAISTYEAELPNAKARRINLKLNVNWQDRYGGEAYAPKNQAAPVKVEIFNFARGIWQPLNLRDTNPPKPQKTSGAPSPPAPAPAPPRVPAPAPPSATYYSPRSNWKLETNLSGDALKSLIQQPDGRVLFRVRTASDYARLSQIDVTAE